VIGFAQRVRVPELMDRPDVDPRLLRRALDNLGRVNRYLGGARAVLDALSELSAGWRPGERLVLADLGTGAADLPRAMVAWGRARGFAVEVVGVDLHPQTIREASGREAAAASPGVELVRADALALPLADRSVDYAVSSQLLHHLSEDEGARLLAEMDRVARRGLVVQDLVRSVRAWLWIRALTALFGDPITRFDGPASVRQAFLPAEALALARAAGLDWVRARRHFGHRFTLLGERARP